ncbi:MAG: hypothetical protein ACR2JB_18470 [Bryobacteraceae bacterium]
MGVDIPDIERIVFFPGQPLRADDMTDLEATSRELRWLHNRSLHPWGIGVGLEVSGERGATVVKVQPGYAVDRLGRELILSTVESLPIPAVPGSATGGDAIFYLVLRYLPDSAQDTFETRKGVCRPGGSVRLSDRPALDWKTSGTLQDGIDIVLGTIRVKNCMLSARVLLTSRRMINPPQLSYVAGGKTLAGATLLLYSSGDGQTATQGTTLPQPLAARAVDGANNPLTGLTVSYSALTGGGTFDTVVEKPGGIYLTNWKLGPPGPQTAVAKVAGSALTVQFQAISKP